MFVAYVVALNGAVGFLTWLAAKTLRSSAAMVGRSPSIQCDLCDGNHGILTMTVSLRGAETKQRAVLRVAGEDDRYFGTRRSTAVESTEDLLDRMSDRLSDEERSRILAVVRDFDQRRSFSVPSPGRIRGSQPRCVLLVHQIFGVFRDNKPMSRLCQNSLRRWRQVAQQMGGRHHLWDADEVDALVKQNYPQHWDMYHNVAFPVMRSYIARIAILHRFGGLYADLDTYPNRSAYSATSFAVQKVHPVGRLTAKKSRFAAKKTPAAISKSTALDMGVLVGSQGNPMFLRWLDYMSEQIASKDYRSSKCWPNSKMRYICQTTGSASMNRFLRLSENADVLKAMKFLHCNHCQDAPATSVLTKRMYDVLSYPSQSCSDEMEAFVSVVGEGDGQVPALEGSQPRLRRRIRGKTKCMAPNPCQPEALSQDCVAVYMEKRRRLEDEEMPGKGNEPNGKRWEGRVLQRSGTWMERKGRMMEGMAMLEADRDAWRNLAKQHAEHSAVRGELVEAQERQLETMSRSNVLMKEQKEWMAEYAARQKHNAEETEKEAGVMREFLQERGYLRRGEIIRFDENGEESRPQMVCLHHNCGRRWLCKACVALRKREGVAPQGSQPSLPAASVTQA